MKRMMRVYDVRRTTKTTTYANQNDNNMVLSLYSHYRSPFFVGPVHYIVLWKLRDCRFDNFDKFVGCESSWQSTRSSGVSPQTWFYLRRTCEFYFGKGFIIESM